MSKILLIWENIPESTDAYILDASSKLADLAIASAGKFINADDLPEEHPIFALNDAIYTGKLQLERASIENPLEGPFDSVIVCGFYM